MSRKVTIYDIASKSGASSTTVSLVLRDKPGIGDDTRRRVLDAARDLGYQRRTAAVTPGTAATATTIAMILRSRSHVDTGQFPTVNSFYSLVMTGIESAARMARFNLLYATVLVDSRNCAVELPDFLLEQDLGGMMLIGAFSSDTIEQLARRTDAPVVVVDGPAQAGPYDAVVSDNEGGAASAVQYLIDHGHQDIAMFPTSTSADPNFEQRYEGYAQTMTGAGLRPVAVPSEVTRGIEQIQAWLASHPECTAVFGCNDDAALKVMRAAQQVGKIVPGQLSVMGFDDIAQAGIIHPGLTTMAVDKMAMGRLAVMLMSHRLAWPESSPALAILSPVVRPRDSVARATQVDRHVMAGTDSV